MSGITAIAMSGGVDSLVAASLLAEQGASVAGIHFLTGFGSSCEQDPAMDHLALAAKRLGIPLHVVDLSRQFRSLVVEPFVDAYLSGQTPNPCMVCNPAIKFGVLLEQARALLGADRLATGHYAGIRRGSHGRLSLLKGKDLFKDQSYFLGFLSQEQLACAVFPLEGLTKSQVRSMARERGLEGFVKEESQEICFIADNQYRAFLKGRPGFKQRPGDIVLQNGAVVGRHEGVHAFTIGQRRGINVPAPEAYYVKAIEPELNRIVVCGKSDLRSRSALIRNINWMQKPPDAPLRAATRIRHRHIEAPSTISPKGDDAAIVTFDEPQNAVTPGQGAVFYLEEQVLGAGWISSASG